MNTQGMTHRRSYNFVECDLIRQSNYMELKNCWIDFRKMNPCLMKDLMQNYGMLKRVPTLARMDMMNPEDRADF